MHLPMPPRIVVIPSELPVSDRLLAAKNLVCAGNLALVRSWPTECDLTHDLATFGPIFEPVKLPPDKALGAVTSVVESETIASAASWHHDQSFAPDPPTWSALLCLDPGENAVPTFFCDGAALLALHSSGFVTTLERLTARHEAYYDGEATDPANRVGAPHSVVQVVEGDVRALFVSPATVESFDGWALDESTPILDRLFAAMNWPEVTVGHSWHVGDLLLWPNRRYLHRALPLQAGLRMRRLSRVVGHWR